MGCKHCYPAVATNEFNADFLCASGATSLDRALETSCQAWPLLLGEYSVLGDGKDHPIAVSTLASAVLAERLAELKPRGLCIVGKTETENIGIDKLVKNVVANPHIRTLIVAGKDPNGHLSGATLLALKENGVDKTMRVVGSHGKRPILKNVTPTEVEAFRRQVQVVDLVGYEDAEVIARAVEEAADKVSSIIPPSLRYENDFAQSQTAPIIEAREPAAIQLDQAGYFVIYPRPEKGILTVEHYSYDNVLLRMIEGKDAGTIYWTIIEKGWVTQLGHAAYLGKELTKAQLSMELGFKYVQDGA